MARLNLLMKRGPRVAALLLGVQVLFVAIYVAVEYRRDAGAGAKATAPGLSGATVPLRKAAPELIYLTSTKFSKWSSLLVLVR